VDRVYFSISFFLVVYSIGRMLIELVLQFKNRTLPKRHRDEHILIILSILISTILMIFAVFISFGNVLEWFFSQFYIALSVVLHTAGIDLLLEHLKNERINKKFL